MMGLILRRNYDFRSNLMVPLGSSKMYMTVLQYMFVTVTGPTYNAVPLSLQNMSDLDLDSFRVTKVKFNGGFWLPHDFLLQSNSDHMSTSCLCCIVYLFNTVVAVWQFSSLLLSGQSMGRPHTDSYCWAIILKSDHSTLVKWKAPIKKSWLAITFWDILFTDDVHRRSETDKPRVQQSYGGVSNVPEQTFCVSALIF